MINSFRGTILLAGSLVLGGSLSLQADDLFNNTTTDLNYRFQSGTSEVGDQIILTSAGMYLTNFSFEFFGTNTAAAAATSFAGPVQARVRFYLNDGTPFNGVLSPGTVLYSSQWFGIGGVPSAGRATINVTTADFEAAGFGSQGLFLPVSELTWSIQFRFLGATDELGVDIFSPPTVGQDYPDYWRFDNSRGWVLETNAVPMDFAARFQGQVPEPTTLSLSLLGGLGLFFARRKFTAK